jgi:hypothetical protein
MNKGERVKSLMGPGGLRCGCCGGQGGRRRGTHRRMVRGAVRMARKTSNRREVREGRRELEDKRGETA